MKPEMEILPTGEIRSCDAYIGTVSWSVPMADARYGGYAVIMGYRL